MFWFALILVYFALLATGLLFMAGAAKLSESLDGHNSPEIATRAETRYALR